MATGRTLSQFAVPCRARLPSGLILTLAALFVCGCGSHPAQTAPAATIQAAAPTTATPLLPVAKETLPVTQLSIGSIELEGYLGPGQATAVAVQPGLAFVGFGIQFAIVDMHSVGSPRRLGYLVLPGYVVDVAVSRNVAYVVTSGSTGLHVIDVSDPSSPLLLETLYAGTPTDGVVVAGSYAYVTNGRFHILDVSDPTVPREVGWCDFVGEPPMTSGRVLAIAGGSALTGYHGGSAQSGGLRVVDISDPAAPAPAAHLGLVGWPYHLAVIGDRAFLLSGYGNPHLTVVDISDPQHLAETSPDPTRPWLGWSLAAIDDLLLLTYPGPPDGPDGLQVLDVTDPAKPRVLGTYDGIPRPPSEVVVDGNLATVASGDGLVILDISEPGAPSLSGIYRQEILSLPLEGVTIRDPYAYIAAGEAGLWIVDISEMANPMVVGSVHTGGHAWAVALSGSYAYLADEHAGLRIIDVSDPQKPTEVGYYDLPGRAEFFHGVAVEGHHAYVADGSLENTGLRIFDISDPSQPIQASFLPLSAERDTIPPPRLEDVAVRCDASSVCTAYLAAGTDGLHLVDVSVPASPVEIGHHQTPGRADTVAVAGSSLFLVDGDLRILDVSDPMAIVESGFYDAPDTAGTLYAAVQGHYVYLSGDGLRILDVSHPGQPRQVAAHPLPSGRVAVEGERILVAGNGLFILRSGPSTH